MRGLVKRLLKRKKTMQIVITFTRQADGSINTDTKMSNDIPVSYAITILDRLRWDIQTRLTNKAQIAGINSKKTRARAFVKAQTLGDIN